MDKNAIKKYATWARRELIARVSQKAEQYGITEQNPGELHAESVEGRLLSKTEQTQCDALILRVRKSGYRQVMEEVAFTWFNRFCALRFMEVNGYLPTRIRIFTDENNAFKPQILSEAIHMEMDGLDMDRVYQLKSDNKTEELYKYLLVTQCNALSSILPGMFQRIADYTELLLPDNLLRKGSVIEQLVRPQSEGGIPESDWTDQVQIIGWLYQYYNTEPKDQVFADLKKNIKISKEKIPAATQLFTPDWIVRYMVENSLGRLWLEYGPQGMSCGNGNDALRELWEYYLDEAEQEPEVQEELDRLRIENRISDPSEIKCIDPCMGSGHILAYMFDVLMQIYTAYGYSSREAVQSIVENNLYGLDIDDRAAQLAYFAVMMKARQYDRRFFTRGIQPHVAGVQESEPMPEAGWGYFGPEQDIARRVYAAFVDAKEYGSLIEPNVTLEELDALEEALLQKRVNLDIAAQTEWMTACNVLWPLVRQARMLVQKYDVVVTNPPYMGGGNMNPRLFAYVKGNYPEYKSDFFSVFFIRCSTMGKQSGKLGFFSPYVWMFIQSYEKLRNYLYTKATIESLIQFEYSAFEEATVPVCTFTLSNLPVKKRGCYLRLTGFRGGMEVQRQKTLEAIDNHECGFYYEQSTDNFTKIPGAPVGYWIPQNLIDTFAAQESSFGNSYECYVGMRTGDNERFLRLWHEVKSCDVAFKDATVEKSFEYRWIPYLKGGDFRRWYYNYDYVVNWKDNGAEVKENTRRVYPQLGENLSWKITSESEYFREGITFNAISSSAIGFKRYMPGSIFSNASHAIMNIDAANLDVALGFLNTKVITYILELISPTINYTPSDIKKIPMLLPPDTTPIAQLAVECLKASMDDWNSFETSWDFQMHPMLPRLPIGSKNVFIESTQKMGSYRIVAHRLEESFSEWEQECATRFQRMQGNEEELNRIFIGIYGLQDELTPEVEDKDVTVRKAELGRDIRSLISYAVGCMFGRYSLDVPGLIYAGGDWNESFLLDPVVPDSRYNDNETVMILDGYYINNRENQYIPCSFSPDKDNILPICDDEYFEDDIVGRFVKFIEVVYGKDTLEENLKFIAEALGGKGSPRDVIRSYFLNDFYADHLKTYQKRPIYWLFDSGKKNGFKCLIYMHRYAPDTIARIRTDYVHEQQSRYRTAIADLENRIAGAATVERVRLTKQLNKLQAQAEEIRLYEEKIHHLADQMIAIDLDDGVKVNYAKFADVLAKIK